jgi:hypothetical protein
MEWANTLNKNHEPLPLPNKKIPTPIMIIGTFQLTVALLGLVLVVLAGRLDFDWVIFSILLFIYGAMGAGLWAIQEWARYSNVVLHIVAIPYAMLTALFLEGPSGWHIAAQIIIACGIIFALTRPDIRYKFQTAVPKKRYH